MCASSNVLTKRILIVYKDCLVRYKGVRLLSIFEILSVVILKV